MNLYKRFLAAGCALAFARPALAESGAATPVVVELFESQGCSSCPPSEKVMQSLHNEFGSGIILMTFHVDYWDYLGWKDTFSDPQWTERQKMYGQRFNQDSIYTPEMVVQGHVGFVGSDGRRARREVQEALTTPRPAFTVKTERNAAGIHVIAQVPPALASQVQQLLAVRVENSAAVHVERGENRGETMSGDFAVRALKAMPALTAGKSSVTLVSGTAANTGQVVVLALDGQGALVAAQATPLP